MEKVVLVKLNENATLFSDAISYANNYINYLNATIDVTTAQPYNLETTVMMYKGSGSWTMTEPTEGEYISIQVNKPFTVIGDLITTANNNA